VLEIVGVPVERRFVGLDVGDGSDGRSQIN
jgi:hypothetical protein